MRQFALVGGVFALTLALLFGAWLALGGFTGRAPAPTDVGGATTGGAATASSTEIAPATTPAASSPTLGPSSSASAVTSPAASPTPTPSAAPTPTLAPVPSVVAGQAIVVTLRGQDYVSAQGVDPLHATLTYLSGGGIRLRSDGSTSDSLTVTYRLSPSSLPAGKDIRRIDVKVCGSGSGDFWESYGPPGSEPVEYEAEPPATDGCWHFAAAPGPDSTVIVAVNIAAINVTSTMQIDRVVYTVTVN
jgi:hypothetical protein